LIFGQFWIIGVGLAIVFSVIYLMKYVNDRKKEDERIEESWNNIDWDKFHENNLPLEYRMKRDRELKEAAEAKETTI